MAKRPCKQPGCSSIVEHGYCDEHRRKAYKASDNVYNNRAWRNASKQYLAMNPLCIECYNNGHIKQAECVDHIQPHKGDMVLFWNQANWQALCNVCHSAKTAKENNFGHINE